MCTNSICRSTHHARKCRLVSSGPLSQRIACGRPRSLTIASSTRVTLRLAKLVSTSKAKHSRVNASTTLSTRIVRPHSTASCTKSSAHSWFAAVAPPAAFPRARNVSVSSAGSSIPPPDTLDARACGLPARPSGPTIHAAADSRIVVSPVLTPPAVLATVHPCASFRSGNSIPPSSAGRTLVAH